MTENALLFPHASRREERRAKFQEMADLAFKDHVLTNEGPGRWYCGRPNGSSTYHFRLVTSPACLLLYGDIHDVIFRMSEGDALVWLRSCVDQLDYVLGKVSAFDVNATQYEFSRGDAFRRLEELEKEYGDRGTRARRDYARRRDREGDMTAWAKAMDDNGFDSDVPKDWDSQLLWQYHALRHFCRLLDKQETIEKEAHAGSSV